MFGRTEDEDDAVGEEKTSWDQEEEKEEDEDEEEQSNLVSSGLSSDPSTEKDESTGFKFSLFGGEAEPGGAETGGFYLR